MMKIILPVLLIAFAMVVRADEKNVATILGYTNNVQRVAIGPYGADYGENQTSPLFLVYKGKHNIFSKESDGTTIYQKGLPWLTYDSDSNGNPTNLTLTIFSEDNMPRIIMIDDEADGQWDKKLDVKAKKKFVWRDNQWNEDK